MGAGDYSEISVSADGAAAEARRAAPLAARPRILFIDNIRWTMIVLVLSMHAVDTYSPFGNWYYTDRREQSLPAAVAFATYQSFLQAFFMALLFFIAACFAPGSYDKKGFAPFVRDRFVRLGLPTLLYIFAIGPLTEYYVSRTWTGGGGFVHQWLGHVTDGEWLSGTGPMWFCAALLVFSVVYGLVRLVADGLRLRDARPALPSTAVIAGFVAAMAAATFLVRIGVPESASVLNMHPGDFPQYVLMFGAGILSSRGRWLDRLPDRAAVRWSAAALALSVPLWIALVFLGGARDGDAQSYAGGLNWVSAGKCLWEALICVGMSLALVVLYRRRFDAQGAFARLLSDNAFAVYVFHPPIIIAAALLLRSWHANPILKAASLTGLAAVAAFGIAALALRRMPLLKRIL